MDGVSFSATTEKRKGILFDPRTKLVLLLTITTLMFSTSNEGIMNIVKPCLSLVPFVLILSEHRFKNSRKIFAALCSLLCIGADCPCVFKWPAFLYRACDYIYHDTICTWHHDRRMADLINFRQRIYQCDGAYAHHRKNCHPHVCDFSFFPTISEEYQAIRDAMKMRNIRFGGKIPF